MFSGLLLLSDVSGISVLILAVLLLVFESNFFLYYLKLLFQLFCRSLCLDHFLKVFYAIRGIISSFLNAALMSWFFSFIFAVRKKLTQESINVTP